MNNRQVQLVKGSWDFLKVQEPELAERFYDRLFTMAPQARAMFTDDMTEQKRKFRVTIGTVINSLGRFEEVEAIVRALGKRHVGYGTQEPHYELVGQALIGTLHEMHGPTWNAELEAAWVGAYTAVADTMKGAAAEPAPQTLPPPPPAQTVEPLRSPVAQASTPTSTRMGWLGWLLGLFRT